MFKLKRSFLLFLFGLFIVNAGFAQYNTYDQSSTFGLKFGTIYSKIEVASDAAQVIDGDSEFGLQFGAFYRFQINNVYIQPGLDMAVITNKLVLLDFRGTTNYPATGEDENLDLKFHTTITTY